MQNSKTADKSTINFQLTFRRMHGKCQIVRVGIAYIAKEKITLKSYQYKSATANVCTTLCFLTSAFISDIMIISSGEFSPDLAYSSVVKLFNDIFTHLRLRCITYLKSFHFLFSLYYSGRKNSPTVISTNSLFLSKMSLVALYLFC